MTEHQYNSFTASKFITMMYKDKMLIESGKHNGDFEIVHGEGIDLDFYSDVYIPFMMWYNAEQLKFNF